MSDLPAVQNESTDVAVKDSTAEEIKTLAAPLVPAAMATLAKLSKGGKKIPATVQRAAANDILTQAAGRPEARTVAADPGGLKVVINCLFGDPPEKSVNSKGEPRITRQDVIDTISEPVD